jgi:hypothetical protein
VQSDTLGRFHGTDKGTHSVRNLPALRFKGDYTQDISMWKTHKKRKPRISSPAFRRARSLQNRLTLSGCLLAVLSSAACPIHAQSTSPAPQTPASTAQEYTGTSTDLFVMFGSDFDRPGLLPRANYNIGIGHSLGFLNKCPVGDELTFSYTYENSGSHGFLHTRFGEHTETAGIMKNFSLPKTKTVTGYTWVQGGATTYTGNAQVQNRFVSGLSVGAVVHFTRNNSIWIQESYNKVVTVPWYTTSSIGYTYSW